MLGGLIMPKPILDRSVLSSEVVSSLSDLMKKFGLNVSGDGSSTNEISEDDFTSALITAFSNLSKMEISNSSRSTNGSKATLSVLDTSSLQRFGAIIAKMKDDDEVIKLGVSGFMQSVERIMGQYLRLDVGEAVIRGGTGVFIPMSIDWDDSKSAKGFEDYFEIPKDILTHHTKHQMWLTQLMSHVDGLSVGDLSFEISRNLRRMKTRIDGVIADLKMYFFDSFAMPRLHTERIQNGLFDDGRHNRVYVGRLALNVTDMNEIDPTGELGTFVLGSVKKWFATHQKDIRGAVQSAEYTSFQFILEKPEDAYKLFRMFRHEIGKQMNLDFNNMYGERSLDDRAKRLLRYINRFKIRGTVVVRKIDARNLISYAIQKASDVNEFMNVLKHAGVPSEILRAFSDESDEEKQFLAMKPWLPNVEVDIKGIKEWLSDSNVSDVVRFKRKQLFQAFILQGIYYFLRETSGVLDYFEKAVASSGDVSVYVDKDLPYDGVKNPLVRGYIQDAKYVSDGKYIPHVMHDEVMQGDFTGNLASVRVLEKEFELRELDKPEEYASKLLRIWPRISHEWGALTHVPRENNRGGAREVFFSAIDALCDAIDSGVDDENLIVLLAKVKETGKSFLSTIQEIWSKSLSDPRNIFFLKRRSFGEDANGGTVNAAVFYQELARAGWTNVFAIEADSIQRYLKEHSIEFSPDFNDAAFQSIWDVIFEVQSDWHMPIPIVWAPAGDLIRVIISPTDVYNNTVDPAAFMYEVWSRVRKKYHKMPYHDVKKVEFAQIKLPKVEGKDLGNLNDALLAVANEKNLQAVPFAMEDRDDNIILYVPTHNGWNNNKDIVIGDILADIAGRSYSVDNFKVGDVSVKRVWIYKRNKEGRIKYRYSITKLGKEWEPFYKTLTITTILGKLPVLGSTQDLRRIEQINDAMAKQAEIEKDRKFLRKAGFGFHETAMDEWSSVLSSRMSSMRSFVDYIHSKIMNSIKDVLGLDENRLGANETIFNMAIHANSYWQPQIEMAISRFKAENRALGRIMKYRSNISSDEDVLSMKEKREDIMKIIRIKREAIRILGKVSLLLKPFQSLADDIKEDKKEVVAEDDVLKLKAAYSNLHDQMQAFKEMRDGIDGNGGENGGTPLQSTPAAGGGGLHGITPSPVYHRQNFEYDVFGDGTSFGVSAPRFSPFFTLQPSNMPPMTPLLP